MSNNVNLSWKEKLKKTQVYQSLMGIFRKKKKGKTVIKVSEIPDNSCVLIEDDGILYAICREGEKSGKFRVAKRKRNRWV